jgi:hypothetical protein
MIPHTNASDGNGYLFPFATSPSTPFVNEAFQFLNRPGFAQCAGDSFYLGRSSSKEQGTSALRRTALKLSRKNPHIMSLDSLAEARIRNSTFNILLYKQVSHVFDLKTEGIEPESLALIFGEGFHESFSIPFWVDALAELLKIYKEEGAGALAFAMKALDKTYILEGMTEGDFETLLSDLHNPAFKGPVLMATGFDWHAAIFGIFDEMAFYSNKGVDSTSTLNIYEFQDKSLLTTDLASRILHRMHHVRSTYMNERLLEAQLQMNLLCSHPAKHHINGVCTRANTSGAIKNLLILFHLKLNFSEAERKASRIYKIATSFYRLYTLQSLLKIISEHETPSVVYKIFYKALLSPVLEKTSRKKFTVFTAEKAKLLEIGAHILKTIE